MIHQTDLSGPPRAEVAVRPTFRVGAGTILLVAGLVSFALGTTTAEATPRRNYGPTAPTPLHDSPDSIPPAVLDVVCGMRLQDLSGPVEWLETTSNFAEYGSREGKGLPDVPVWLIQSTGSFTAYGPVFAGAPREAIHPTVSRSVQPITPGQDGFYGRGGSDTFAPRDLSLLGQVHYLGIDCIREIQQNFHC